jgi:hypothetical protein
MKRTILFITMALIAFGTVQAQQEKVDEVTAEQKLMKAKEFREDNQKYLKSLGMDDDQMIDIDNVNSCHSYTLERISHYATDKGAQKKHLDMAKANHRAQLDLIMGAKNREKYEKYVTEKVRKMQASMQAGKQ